MNIPTELILINVTGEDRPGLTSALTEILGRHHATILDIGQSTIHNFLSLGLLIRTEAAVSGNILKELLFKATELNLNIRFTPTAIADYEEWVTQQGKGKWIITLLGRRVTADHIAILTAEVAHRGLNIESIKRLTGRISLSDTASAHTKTCIELSVRGNPKDREEFSRRLLAIASDNDVDISFQEDTVFRRTRRLICFDMDSTLIETEVIDELAIRAGVGDKVKEITARAMRGEIDFIESFRERVALLRGLDVSVMEDIAEHLPITEGLERMMTVLKRAGYKTAILSGGFTYFGEYLKRKYGFDYVYANELEVGPDGKLTGRYVGDVVDGRRKAELLRLLAQVENVNIAQTIAVGDGANDLPMLATAGLGIAFHAKPKVKQTADQSLSTTGLDGVLYFLGFKDTYIDKM